MNVLQLSTQHNRLYEELENEKNIFKYSTKVTNETNNNRKSVKIKINLLRWNKIISENRSLNESISKFSNTTSLHHNLQIENKIKLHFMGRY